MEKPEGNPFKLQDNTYRKLRTIKSDMQARDKKDILFDDMLNYIIDEYAKNHRINL